MTPLLSMLTPTILCQEELVRRAPFRVIHSLSEDAVVHIPHTGANVRLPKHALQLLASLDTFLTVAEHTSYCAQSAPTDVLHHMSPTHYADRLMTLLMERGCLISKSAFLSTLDKSALSPVNAISRLIIPTAHRPQFVKRVFSSIISSVLPTHRSTDIVVADGSGSSHEYPTRTLLRTLSKTAPLSILYIGQQERETYVSHLTRLGIDPAPLTFSVLGMPSTLPAYGANRNSLLLASLGRVVFSCDDDVELRGLEQADSSTAIYSDHDGSVVDVLDPPASHFQSLDVLSHHERYLGLPMSALFVNGGCSSDCISDDALLGSLRGSLFVRLTINGVYGDSGMHSGDGILLSDNADTRHRLAHDNSFYRYIMSKATIHRAARQVTIGHYGRSFMSTAFGLDCRTVIPPPFLPVGRGEDTVFGYFFHTDSTRRVMANLPFAIVHKLGMPRVYTPTWITSVATVRLCDVVKGIISYVCADKSKEMDMNTTLASVGGYMQSIATCGAHRFRSALTHLLSREAAKHIHAMHVVLDQTRSTYCSAWREDLYKRAQLLTSRAREASYYVPVDLRSVTNSVDEAVLLCQTLLLKYGQLLDRWSAITEAAMFLGSHGTVIEGSP
jgi:hypothetical protein